MSVCIFGSSVADKIEDITLDVIFEYESIPDIMYNLGLQIRKSFVIDKSDYSTGILIVYDTLVLSGISVDLDELTNVILNDSATNQGFESDGVNTSEEHINRVEGDPINDSIKEVWQHYGSAINIYFKMKLKFKTGLVGSVLINNGKNSYKVVSLKDLNSKIKQLQISYFNEIKQYIMKYGSNVEKEIAEKMSLYDSKGIYMGEWEHLQSFIKSALLPKGKLTGAYLEAISAYGTKGKSFISAYNAYIVLSNFDKLVDAVLGKNITINFGKGTFSSENNKYSIETKNNMPSNWRTNEDVDALKEMDKVTSLLVSTFPVFSDIDTIHEDAYMDMHHFVYITSKVKGINKLYAKTINIRQLEDVYTKLSADTKSFLALNNINTLYLLITSLDTTHNNSFSALFEILAHICHSQKQSNKNILRRLEIRPLDSRYIFTIYNNVYRIGGTKITSLREILRNNQEGNNYFEYIVQAQLSLSGMEYLRYTLSESGNMMDQTLHKAGSDVVKSILERTINSRYSKFTKTYHNALVNTYNVMLLPKTNYVIFNIGDYRITYDPKTKTITIEDSTGNTISNFNAFLFTNLYECIQFIQDVIGTSITSDFIELYKHLKENEYTHWMQDIFRFACDLVSNDAFNHLFKTTEKYNSKSNLDNAVEEFYGNDRKGKLIYKSSSGEYGVFVKDFYSVLQDISLAQSIASGRTSKGTVKDGEGNDLGVSSMSRFYTNIENLWELDCRKESSILKNCSIITSDIVEKSIVAREIKDESTKALTLFNPNESYFASFIYDFLEKINDPDSNHFYILPFVIADKSIVLKNVVNSTNLLRKLASKVEIENLDISIVDSRIADVLTEELLKLHAKEQYLKTLSPKELMKLCTPESIWEAISEEFGEIYKNLINNIKNDWKTLNSFINTNPRLSSILGEDFFDTEYLYNFENTNKKLASLGMSPQEVIELVMREYQKYNPNSDLVIRENIHYIVARGKNIDGTSYSQFHFNPTIVSMHNRFNKLGFTSFGKTIGSEGKIRLTSMEKFVEHSEKHLLSDLLNNKFELDLSLKDRFPNALKALSLDKEWIDASVNKLFLAEITYTDLGGNQTTVKIRTKKLYESIPEEFITSIKLHPLIAMHNAINYFVGQLYVYASMGLPAINPSKMYESKYLDDTSVILDLAEEGDRFTMATKRNVTVTGNMNRYVVDSTEGFQEEVKTAIIEDDKSAVFNLIGDALSATIFDGAIFTAGPSCYLQNKSLKGASAGMDQKPLWHAFHSDIASATIIKTASFGCTNERSRRSNFIKNINRKCLNLLWDLHHDITKDFDGQSIEYEKIIFKDLKGQYIVRDNLTYLGDGHYSYDEHILDPVSGDYIQTTKDETTYINSNYDLYLFFGGDRSCRYNDGVCTLSETSMQNLAKAMCKVGYKKSGVNYVESSKDVHLPLKEACIHFAVTKGAIKKGAGNINSKSAYTNNDPFVYSVINLRHSGIQLDKTHEADGAHVSIMTLVVNTLCAKGFTEQKANEAYQALRQVTLASIADELVAYREFIGEDADPTKLQNILVDIIVKELAYNGGDDVNMAKVVMSKLIEAYNSGTDVGNLNVALPLSDPGVYNKLVSTVASVLNKTAIKIKFSGILSVLTPSHNIYKLYAGRPLDSFANTKELLELLDKVLPVDSSRLNIGSSYFKKYINSTTGELESELITIESPQRYWKERLTQSDDVVYYEAIADELPAIEFIPGEEYLDATREPVIYLPHKHANLDKTGWVKVIPIGRDLNTYNVYFTDTQGRKFSMWDLAVVRKLYNTKDKREQLVLRRELLRQLNALSTKSTDKVTIYTFNGAQSIEEDVEINTNDIEIQAYENILPQIYKSNFGLDAEDDVHEILKLDSKGFPTYFMDKLIKQRVTKMSLSCFDLELKSVKGNHTYLMHPYEGFDPKVRGLKEIHTQIIEDLGTKWFVDVTGKKLGQASSLQDKLYADLDNVLVIVTDNFEYYLELYDYYDVKASKHISEDVQDYIQTLAISTKSEKIKEAFTAYYLKEDKSIVLDWDSLLDDKLTDALKLLIVKKAKRMHSSFLVSLNTLAARIPSLSMQSFMGMKTVAYDHSGVNSVYVNAYLIWLLGSDFDIDTVSMLGYSFNLNGEFIHWSPYADFSNGFNLEYCNALPFPTGKKVENFIYNSDISDTVNLEISNAINTITSFRKYIKNRTFPAKDKLSINMFANAIRTLNKYTVNGEIHMSTSLDDLTLLYIKNILNNHNLYIKNKSNRHLLEITKNYVSATMYEIIQDPINLIQALSPIDKAVDEIKTIGNNSNKAKDVTRNTPGNVYNLGVELFNNIAGKNVTGIVAAGMKGLLGITHATNKTLNEGTTDNVIFQQKIGKNTYKIVANAFSGVITEEMLLQRLIEVKNTDDAVLVLSAVLSLATDNAKELQLSKINATEELVSLYIAGITIGMDIETITEIMMSDTTETLLSVMKGNVFTGLEGMARLDKSFRYFENGLRPKFKNVSSLRSAILKAFEDLDCYEEIMERYVYKHDSDGNIVLNSEGQNAKKQATAYDIQQILAFPDIQWSEEIKLKLFEAIEEFIPAESRLEKGKELVAMNRFLEEFEDWVDAKLLFMLDVDSNGQSRYLQLKSMHEIGIEITATTSIQGINQGMDTDQASIIKFRDNVEELFSRKYNKSYNDVILERYLEEEMTVSFKSPLIAEALSTKSDVVQPNTNVTIQRKNLFSAIAHISKNQFKKYKSTKPSDYSISLTGLLNDAQYREAVFELYDLLKSAVNVPYVIMQNQHYVGYLEAFDVLHYALKAGSYKYRQMITVGMALVNKHKVFDLTEKTNMIKRASKFFDTHIINLWLLTLEIITIPEGITIVDESLLEFVTTAPTDIKLGTTSGNISFKMYIELKVIPDIQKGNMGDGTSKFLSNLFIRDFNPEVLDKTVNRNSINILALPINMTPKTLEEEVLLSKYKEDFSRLQNVSYAGIPLLNLLWYYNLIVHGNALSLKSLMPLFMTLMQEEGFDKMSSYYGFIGDMDRHSMETTGYDKDLLFREITPLGNLYKSYNSYIIARDKDDLNYKLWERGEYTYTVDENGNVTDVSDHPYSESWTLQFLSQPSNFTITKLTPTVLVSPTTYITYKFNEETSKEEINTIVYKGVTYTAAAINKLIKEYNKLYLGEYSEFLIKSIEDLVYKELTVDDVIKINTELTAESIERMFNDPCK